MNKLAAAVGCMVLSVSAAQAQNDPNFRLVNRSSSEITRLYISSPQRTDWGRELLRGQVLGPGEQSTAAPPRGQGCVFDVRVEYADNRIEERRGQDTCRIERMVFDGSNARVAGNNTQRPSAQAQEQRPRTQNPDFAVLNRSDRIIAGLYVSSAQASSWGEDILPGVLNPGERFEVRLPRDGQCVYDVRVVYQDRTVEDKRGQDVCRIEQMAFAGQGAQAPRDAFARAPQPGAAQPRGTQAGSLPPGAQQVSSSGTAFFVTAEGHALTNHHVVRGCGRIASVINGQLVPSTVVGVDQHNDLAVIRAQLPQPVPYASFRAGQGIRVGEDVIAAGFPFAQVLQNGLNVTRGNVSAMGGIGGNTANLQMTAPVQPGNSGGPLFDSSGNIVGVVVARLNSQAVRAETQNINYAVQGPVARLFLESNGVRAAEAPSTQDVRVGDLSDAARTYTFQLVCYQGA